MAGGAVVSAHAAAPTSDAARADARLDVVIVGTTPVENSMENCGMTRERLCSPCDGATITIAHTAHWIT